MRPCIEQSNGPVSLSPFRSWPDCIINTSGYDFRKGQVARSPAPIRSKPSAVPANDRFRPDNRNRAQDFCFQPCSRLEARSQKTQNEPEKISHQTASLARLLSASIPNRIFGTHSVYREIMAPEGLVMTGAAALSRIGRPVPSDTRLARHSAPCQPPIAGPTLPGSSASRYCRPSRAAGCRASRAPRRGSPVRGRGRGSW
jgi:hypothetical protein